MVDNEQPWSDPNHDVVADLQEAKRKGSEVEYVFAKPRVNRRDAEILIINGWVEGRDFDVYGDDSGPRPERGG